MAQIGILEVKVKPDLAGFQQQVNAAVANVGRGIASVGSQVTRDLAGIGARVAAGGALAVAGLAAIGIKTAAGLETATLQFQTLLGSADEAKAKVAELFEFAKKTPFESGPIIEASRRLQVFGGDALNTSENLTMVGDAAAAVAAPIEEVAFWVGRAYSQIKGGQPFGEAAMRLQELGVLTPEVRTEMERLAEAGASSEEVFGALQGQLEEFSGAMELQANTLVGLTSTIKDQFSIGLGEAFMPAFEALKDFLGALRDFGDSPVFQLIIDNIAKLTKAVLSAFTPAIEGLANTLSSLSRSEVNDFFAKLAGWLSDAVGAASDLYTTFEPLAPLILGIGAAMLSTFAGGIPVIGLLAPQISGVTGALLGLVGGVKANRDAVGGFFDSLRGAVGDALPKLQGSIETISDAINSTFQGALRGITPAVEYLVRDLFPTLADVIANIAGPLGELVESFARLASGVILELGPVLEGVATAVGSILASGITVLADILGFMADNVETLIPLVTGLAAAFVTLKVSNQIQQLGSVAKLFDDLALKVLYLGDSLKSSTLGTALQNLKGGAGGAAGAVGMGAGLAGALGALAIGLGVAVGVGKLTEAFQKQKQEAAESAERVRTLKDLIVEYGDSANTATRYIEKALSAGDEDVEDTVKGLRDLGFSYETVGEAIAGNVDVQQEMTDAMGNSIAETYGLTEAQAALIDSFIEGKAMGDEWRTTIDNSDLTGKQKEALFDAAQAARDLNTEVGDLADEYGRGADQADEFVTTTDRIKGITDDATRAVKDLTSALDELKGGTTDLVTAETNHLDAIDATRAALKEAGGDLSGRTEESRAARDAIVAEKDTIEERTKALLASGATVEDATTAAQGWIDGLIESARQAGLSEEAIDDLITTYGLTPEQVSTWVELFGAQEAETTMEDLNTFLDEYDGGESTQTLRLLIASGDLEAAEAEMQRLQDRETIVEIRAALDEGNIDRANTLLATLNDREAVPDIKAALDAGNIDKANQLLSTLNLRVAKPTVDVRDNFTGRAAIVQQRLGQLDSTVADPTVTVNDQTQGVFSRIFGDLFDLDNYVAEPTIRPRSLGVPQGGGGGVPLTAQSQAVTATLLAAPMATTTATDARVLGRATALGIEATEATGQPVFIENRTYLGTVEVTDVVKTEARQIERDRSMKYLTGVP